MNRLIKCFRFVANGNFTTKQPLGSDIDGIAYLKFGVLILLTSAAQQFLFHLRAASQRFPACAWSRWFITSVRSNLYDAILVSNDSRRLELSIGGIETRSVWRLLHRSSEVNGCEFFILTKRTNERFWVWRYQTHLAFMDFFYNADKLVDECSNKKVKIKVSTWW